MIKNQFLSPLPEEKLIQRYKPAFEKLVDGFSSTIISIPHLGHTSHLRYINTDKQIQKRLGITNELFLFIDRDKVIGGYESFLSELLLSINKDNIKLNSFLSQNAYLLNQEVEQQITKISETKPVIISLVIEGKILEYLSEIENLFLILQKNSDSKVSILWITDSKVAREYKVLHPSSTFLTNISYQKNFDLEETQHALKRISNLKGIKISKEILDNCLVLTGGFACTFHQFINGTDFNASEYVKSSLLQIKQEATKNNDLVTTEGLSFLNSLQISDVDFESINLSSNPTAQEINLIRHFKEHINKPLTRDDIAKVIWGNTWTTKYSDWAIDKAISRLRKKILSENYKIITVKNLGYELIKI